MTIDAAEAVKAMKEQSEELPGGSGLRLRADEADHGGIEVVAAMVDRPDAGDQVIEDHGVRLFVESRSVAFLDDKLLDAAGAGEELQFRLTEQR